MKWALHMSRGGCEIPSRPSSFERRPTVWPTGDGCLATSLRRHRPDMHRHSTSFPMCGLTELRFGSSLIQLRYVVRIV